MEFAWKSSKICQIQRDHHHHDKMTLGVGPGQTNRVASVRIAIEQAKDRLMVLF